MSVARFSAISKKQQDSINHTFRKLNASKLITQHNRQSGEILLEHRQDRVRRIAISNRAVLRGENSGKGDAKL
jgi:hypothetical protein